MITLGFRYNYEESVLEYVSKWDCKFDENGNLADRILPEWEVVDSIGLKRENWEGNPEYWIEKYQAELDAGAAYELKNFEQGL